jgi:hypothetical protein
MGAHGLRVSAAPHSLLRAAFAHARVRFAFGGGPIGETRARALRIGGTDGYIIE